MYGRKVTLFVALLLVILPVRAVYASSGITELYCETRIKGLCQIEEEIFESLSVANQFENLNHTFVLYVNGVYEKEVTLREVFVNVGTMPFLTDKGLDKAEDNSLISDGGLNKKEMSVARDAPLGCEHDVDYSCEEWEQNPYVSSLMFRLNNMAPLSFVVEQRYVNGVENATQFAISLITYHPSARIVTYIVKLGERAVKVKVGESLVATTLATLLGAASKGLVDIKAGDIITVDGKGNIIQTRPNTTSNGSGGSGGSGGSSGSISIIGAGGGSVVIGCTGSGGHMVCRPVLIQL